MSNRSLLIVCSQSAKCALALDSLDAVLMALMLEQDVTLVFCGDGVATIKAANGVLLEKLTQLASFGLAEIKVVGDETFTVESLPIDIDFISSMQFSNYLTQHNSLNF